MFMFGEMAKNKFSHRIGSNITVYICYLLRRVIAHIVVGVSMVENYSLQIIVLSSGNCLDKTKTSC